MVHVDGHSVLADRRRGACGGRTLLSAMPPDVIGGWVSTAGKYRNACGSGGLAGTGRDGDVRGWTWVDVLPPDGMQEVRSSNLLSSTSLLFPQVRKPATGSADRCDTDRVLPYS